MSAKRRVLVTTGSRSEFGLLRPVMQAIRKHKKLHLLVAVAGEHLLAPASTWKEVAAEFRIDARVPMQRRADRTRLDHAAATARGMAGFAKAYKKLKPDWVVVLGDRVEAFAAASAASIAGIAVCHIHGGDRAEGIADEAMRHAITKLAHLHCAATKLSAERIIRLGEPKSNVHVTGSPAIDGLSAIKPMGDAEASTLGSPRCVVLLHPSGMLSEREAALFRAIVGELHWCGVATSVVIDPNHDPGSDGIRRAIAELRATCAKARVPAQYARNRGDTPFYAFPGHLPRSRFIALLKRLARQRSAGALPHAFIIGNSSAGLIEAASIGLAAINIGPRQDGRERAGNVREVPYGHGGMWETGPLESTIIKAMKGPRPEPSSVFGDGRSSPRIAALLAKTNPHDPALLRKRNSY